LGDAGGVRAEPPQNLPERFRKSSQYSIDIVWDMGMFIGDITLHITEEGIYNAQVNDEEMKMRAKQIAAEFLPDVSNPPFPIRVIFSVEYPNNTGSTIKLTAHIEKGDITAFCTGAGVDFHIQFWSGSPTAEVNAEYPVSIRLGLDVQGGSVQFCD